MKIKKSDNTLPKLKPAIYLTLISLILSCALAGCKDSDESSDEAVSVEVESAEESNGDKTSKGDDVESESEEDESYQSDDESESSEEDLSADDVSADEVGSEYSHIAWFKNENGSRYVSYAKENPEFTEEQIVTYVNMGLDGDYYTNTYKADVDDGIFILVNKYSYVDEDYVPENLVELDDACKVSNKSVKLVKEAADAFASLSADAAKLEYCILGMSGYRSFSYQQNLYNNYLKKDSKEVVDTYSARPGYSEHHTGFALDVQTDTVSYQNFGQTKEYEWLLDNAHKYGFVIHYTEANKWITGYMAEEWHIRYLGVEAATYIYEHNLTVDEYLVMYGADGPVAAG